MAPRLSREQLGKRGPRLVVIAIAIAVAVIILLEILEDVLIEGTPITSSPIVTSIISFTRNITGTISYWGYPSIFLLMLLESSSLPIPSEVILPFAGYLVSIGKLNFWAVIAVATVAAISGSLVDYYIGLKGVHALTQRRILGRAFLSESQLNTVGNWFKKYGAIMVFVGRLIPVFRTLVSFPAGAVRMSLKKFVAYTAVGCLLWDGILIYVGYFLGTRWSQVAGILHYVVIAVVVITIVVLASYWVWRKKRSPASLDRTSASRETC